MPPKRVVFEVVGDGSPRAFATTEQDHRQAVALYLWNLTHGGLVARAPLSPEESFCYEVISRFEDDTEIQILLHDVSLDRTSRNPAVLRKPR